MRAPLIATVVALAFALVACGSDDGEASSEPCIVTFGGAKLCGTDATSWCVEFDPTGRSAGCRAINPKAPRAKSEQGLKYICYDKDGEPRTQRKPCR